jgi:uncharacterized membrane protein YphA (DoxX/SURF4 family)
MLIARIVVSLLLVVLFLITGGVKLLRNRSSTANREALGVPPRLWWTIGVCEWIGAAGLIVGIWAPAAGLAASVGLVVLIIGAMVFRARAVSDQRAGIAADVVVLIVLLLSVVLSAIAVFGPA